MIARRAFGLLVVVFAVVPAAHANDASPPRIVAPSHYVVWADDCRTTLGSWTDAQGLLDGARVVELRRVADADSKLVQAWLSSRALTFQPSDVTVTLVDSLGLPLRSWELWHAFPLHWSIAYLDAGASPVSLETLDLAHAGMTPVDPC